MKAKFGDGLRKFSMYLKRNKESITLDLTEGRPAEQIGLSCKYFVSGMSALNKSIRANPKFFLAFTKLVANP